MFKDQEIISAYIRKDREVSTKSNNQLFEK